MAYGDAATALAALADPTRRRLFETLGREDRTVGELAELGGITQPAASQHLKVLREARLVTSRSEGTRRYYRASPEGLAELRRYIESFWDDALAAFATPYDGGAPPPPGGAGKPRGPRAGAARASRKKGTSR